jgi:hypothetical protein
MPLSSVSSLSQAFRYVPVVKPYPTHPHVQLADKAISSPLTRVLVIFGACAGLLYSSLWYFPTLIIIGGVVNCGWEMLLRNWTARLQRWWVAKRRPRSPAEADEAPPTDSVELLTMPTDAAESLRKRNPSDRSSIGRGNAPAAMESEHTAPAQADSAYPIHTVSIKVGLCIVFSVLGQPLVLFNV